MDPLSKVQRPSWTGPISAHCERPESLTLNLVWPSR